MGYPGSTRRHGPDIALKALHAARSPTNSPAPPLPAPRQRLDCPASQSKSADDYYCGQLLPRLLKRNTVQALKSKKKKKKVRMLSNLANYLLGGNISSAQDAREGSNNESPESLPVMARLSQVEVEGDDWILIDPAVEGATALEESWYVTPPACFTWAGPVNVETSPLEDLLIEHPSMSVYRATASPVAPDTPPPTPDEPEAKDAEEDALIPAVSAKTKGRRVQEDVRTPVAFAKTKGRRVQEGTRTPVASAKTKERDVKEHISNRAVTAALERSPGRTENDQQSRRPAIHDGRPAVGRVRTEKRIIQLRSAQKVLEKRSTQLLKRSHLERSNKLSEVFSVRGKRPRRQDRLRIQNSGVNNNRKCC